MKRIIGLLLIVFCFFLSGEAQEVNLTGEWTITQDTPGGKRSSDVSIKHEGSKATVWSGEGEYIMTIAGENISWSQPMVTPMGSMQADCIGKIESGSKMSGTTSFSEGPLSGRSINWSADRKKTKEQIEQEKAEKKAKKDNKKKKKDNG